ncbi:hypothetical protein OS493_027259 [Desmophyllum pertusum]|uniref:Uncharacterized protein n=1 Tax=Desmophyllum pertusum TaxID=174260 RepID=A0A9X0CVM2_9CNID|nr:hypothetical protein OS493_027259 [Desmophyllum pertusum]
MAMENALLKEKVSNLEKKLAASVKEKAFNRGKAFSSLSPSRRDTESKKSEIFCFLYLKGFPQTGQHSEWMVMKDQLCQKINAGQATVQPIESEDEKIKKVLLAKDNALLNDAGYHELKMVPGSGLPSLSKLKKERKRQNAAIPIEPIHTEKEGHEQLTSCMKSIFQEMKDLERNGLDYNGRHFKIEWLVCSDWKFLAILLGLSGARAKYFCIWCRCSKEQILDFLINSWDISRNHEEIPALLQKKKQKKECFGHNNEPLIHVPFDRVVVDTLQPLSKNNGKLLNQVFL